MLDALREQDAEVYAQSQFERAQIIANDANTPFNKKIAKISKLNFKGAGRFCMELFIKHKEPMEGFDRFPPIEQAIDLISDFPAAVNTQDAEYNALF